MRDIFRNGTDWVRFLPRKSKQLLQLCLYDVAEGRVHFQFVIHAWASFNLSILGLAPEIPEDLYHLIKKAVSVRKHLERNRKDKDSKYRLILIESRIHRLARYYKKTGQLPAVWKYESASASALVA